MYDKINNHYAPRIEPQAPGWKILDWASEEAQVKRFETLVKHLRGKAGGLPRNMSLLDVGCGTADLLAYLENEIPDARYTGVDLLEKIIHEARRRHPNATLLQADIFNESVFEPQSFDVVFCSGVFNLELGNNVEFLTRALPTLWTLARHKVVVNMLHARAEKKYPTCHYYEPEDVVRMCGEHTKRVVLDEGYLENDFTVVLEKA